MAKRKTTVPKLREIDDSLLDGQSGRVLDAHATLPAARAGVPV